MKDSYAEFWRSLAMAVDVLIGIAKTPCAFARAGSGSG